DIERAPKAERYALSLRHLAFADLLVVHEQRQGAPLAVAAAVVLKLGANLDRTAGERIGRGDARRLSSQEVPGEYRMIVADIEPEATVSASQREYTAVRGAGFGFDVRRDREGLVQQVRRAAGRQRDKARIVGERRASRSRRRTTLQFSIQPL